MPHDNSRQPKYRHYKPKDLAVVRIDGRDIYLGKFNSPESLEKYGRVLAEWRASGVVPVASSAVVPVVPDDGPVTITELIVAFMRHAETFYRRPDGTPTGELNNYRDAFRPLRALYGTTPAKDFGPLALKAVRQAMVDKDLSRRVINRRVQRIKRLIGYGVENELLPASNHHALLAVKALGAGRSEAREKAPVRPVPDAHVDAVQPYLSRQLWAVVSLQRLTGMRSSEALALRGADLDTTGDVWLYSCASHKSAHHGRERQIPIGPRAQAILRPWLRADPSEPLFQPREAEAERNAEKRRKRASPMTPSQAARKAKADRKRAPGDSYDARAYAHAIKRACDRAGVDSWHPHQLRHNAATWLRKEFGIEVARVILGHASAAVTETYAQIDKSKAIAAMQQVG